MLSIVCPLVVKNTTENTPKSTRDVNSTRKDNCSIASIGKFYNYSLHDDWLTKMKKNINWSLTLLFVTSICFGYSSKPPTRTGAPGTPDQGQNCLSCHGSSSSGTLVIQNLPSQYTIGQKYSISVTLSQLGRQRWGFVLTALDEDRNRAGTLESFDGNTQVFQSGERQYIGHTSIGTAAGKVNSNTWIFNWTAPQVNVGKISFYASGNAANNNSWTSGDNGYKTQTTIEPEVINQTAPVAVAQSVTTSEDKSATITLSASDADGDELAYTIVSQPNYGTLTGTPPNLTYTPNSGYAGNDTFSFKVNDGTVDSSIATVSLRVIAVNKNPVAVAQSVTTSEDKSATITLSASDADGDELAYTIVSQPNYGTLTGTPPNLTYTPNSGYAGNDTFSFKVNDGTVDSSIATVSVSIVTVVEIHDDNLKLKLESLLGKDSSERVTNLELSQLVGKLDASNSNIRDLKGIEYCINLTELDLSGNSINDINLLLALNKLNLLRIEGNPLTISASPIIKTIEARGTKVVYDPIPSSEKLIGDVNSDNEVNIFDLVMVASEFGKIEGNLKGDINLDGLVNIFDLVLVARNFGKSFAIAPSIVQKIRLNSDEIQNIAFAINYLRLKNGHSGAEETILHVLESILTQTLPKQSRLLPNYPNPFNPETWIPFRAAKDGNASVTIYDINGMIIRFLPIGYVLAGNYLGPDKAIYWDGKTDAGEYVSSGTYFYRIKLVDYTETRKMVIVK